MTRIRLAADPAGWDGPKGYRRARWWRSGHWLLLVVFRVVEVAGEVGFLARGEGSVGPLLLGDRLLAVHTNRFRLSLFPHRRTPDRSLGLHGLWTPYHV